MNLRHIGRSGRQARAARPARLIGHDHAATAGCRQGSSQLLFDDGQRPSGITFLASLADADDRRQARSESCRRLCLYQRVLFPMVLPPLGMADDDVAAAQIRQHRGADIAGMSAGFGWMAILATQREPRLKHERGKRIEENEGRTDEKIAGRSCTFSLLSQPRQLRNQVPSFFPGTIHLPVAGNQRPPHRALLLAGWPSGWMDSASLACIPGSSQLGRPGRRRAGGSRAIAFEGWRTGAALIAGIRCPSRRALAYLAWSPLRVRVWRG